MVNIYPIAKNFLDKTGTARCLSVGINKHWMAPLNGCDNDSLLIYKNYTDIFNFKKSNCELLIDENATKENITTCLKQMISTSVSGDTITFHMSSHGSQLPDPTGKEADGLNEVVVCYSRPDQIWYKDCVIIDDDFAEMFSKLKPGVRVLITLDCCHTGTGTRNIGDLSRTNLVRYLPPPLEVAQKMIKIAQNLQEKMTQIDNSYGRNLEKDKICPITRMILSDIVSKLFSGFTKKNTNISLNSDPNCKLVNMPGEVIFYAGCKDVETSNDTIRNGMYMGAMTSSFLEAINENLNQAITYQQHYGSLISSMIKYGDYKTQHPQLEIDYKYATNQFMF